MDSGATEHFTPDANGLYDYVVANPGTTVEAANNTHEEVKGYGILDLLVKQLGGRGTRSDDKNSADSGTCSESSP